MSAEDILKSRERSALDNNQFVSHVDGKQSGMKTSKKTKSLGAIGLIVAMVGVFAIFAGMQNMLPATILEKLTEATDTQCADMVMSKNLAIQQAMREGELPDDTTKLLNENRIQVGYINNNGDFIEDNKNPGVSLVLKNGEEIITVNDYMEKISTDMIFYNATNNATYECAAYYYDDGANEVFKEIGTNRNNFTNDSDLEETMNSLMNNSSNVSINSVSEVQRTYENPETGETETYYEYVENGEAANSKTEAMTFIEAVGKKNSASSVDEATLNAADTLKVADTISKEQKSSLFYSLMMENISKMKAGDGNESKVSDVMNYLYDRTETEVVDIKTGEIKEVVGSAMDSPSLYAILSGNKLNVAEVEDYSSDRILKTIENQVNISSDTVISGTVASSTSNTKGSIGRFISDSVNSASNTILSLVEPTVSNSLTKNTYSDNRGINAGETLVEGAVNVGKMLAKKSGATSGSEEAVKSYARLNDKIIAMNVAVDRINRSPFDITSRNTFLGSIVYNFAIASMKFSGIFSGVKTFSSTINTAIASLLPTSYADDSEEYLTTFGDCETYSTIGTVGTAQCSEITTFDTSTLNDPFNDVGFIDFVDNNTILDSSGTRKIKEGSDLAKFILYNNERKTPLGVTDGGILDSLNNNSNSIPFMTNILNMVEVFLGTSEKDKKVATGEVFVNSASNPDWQTYKYAQRYVSLARATAALKQYSNDETAYNNLKFFEGGENPVVAFLKQYNTLANK